MQIRSERPVCKGEAIVGEFLKSDNADPSGQHLRFRGKLHCARVSMLEDLLNLWIECQLGF
jgi:hypothetical protein